jgi:RimJ/RimL family protein N-acetyltransferase
LSLSASVPPKDPAGMKEWLAKRLGQPNTFSFIIELRNPADPSAIGTRDNIIGKCGVSRPPEIGYSLDSAYWGKGYGTEATRALIDAYWDTWPVGMPSIPKEIRNEVILRMLPENAASRGIAQKLGFRAIGDGFVRDDRSHLAGVRVLVFKLERPPSERPRAYEKIESVGPNLCEGQILI